MRLEAFDFDLPPRLIAQEPARRRDDSRLMILDRVAGIGEARFYAIGDHLRQGDLLVVNDTRVLPARLQARKPGGGRVELLLLERRAERADGVAWSCLTTAGRSLRRGTRLTIAPGLAAETLSDTTGGRVEVRLEAADGDVAGALERHGRMPLPPYIRRADDDTRAPLDRERYQTVYAREAGAVAAPTAGLHFTTALLDRLEARGIALARLTLHVGPGTFQPVRAADIEDHRIEPEAFRLPQETADAITACRERRGRVVAVGTTVTRVLEDRAAGDGTVRAGAGRCDLYIRPGHRFRVVDALLTNFHLPRSSLLILVAALAGRERILEAYGLAVARGFRFFSYGDAMLIL